MYIPKNCKTLDKVDAQQIRLGIQGYSGTGKTFSALTFPNPVVVNFDRGLGVHRGRTDVIEVPVYDLDFCKSILPNTTISNLGEQSKDVALKWLNTEGMKLETDQTLVWDGGTGTQNAYHKWYAANPSYTKAGKEDEFAEWRLKLVFLGDLMETFKRLKCHVIFISHESDKREKSGEYLGRIRPLMSGQFADQLVSHFTDWFRQMVFDKPKKPEDIKETTLKEWGFKTKEEYLEMNKQFPGNVIYAWQTEADSIFDGGKTSSLIGAPKFIPANYTSFIMNSKQFLSTK